MNCTVDLENRYTPNRKYIKKKLHCCCSRISLAVFKQINDFPKGFSCKMLFIKASLVSFIGLDTSVGCVRNKKGLGNYVQKVKTVFRLLYLQRFKKNNIPHSNDAR